jgi:hypothetical protein
MSWHTIIQVLLIHDFVFGTDRIKDKLQTGSMFPQLNEIK